MNDVTQTKEVLQAQLSQVIADLETIATLNEETGDWVAVPDPQELRETDENSEADAVEEWNERRATLSQLETMYQNIKRALRNIEQETYGLCEVCGGPIEAARLAVIPTARTCTTHMDDERTLSF
jgi:RNA polymerase-binding transcription factor DksA